MQENKTFISKYGWVVGMVLLIATIILQVVFYQVIPAFLDTYRDFGMPSNISIYYTLVSVLMVIAELMILGITIGLFFVKSKGFQQFSKWFFVIYAVLLPTIFVGTIFVLYSGVYALGH